MLKKSDRTVDLRAGRFAAVAHRLDASAVHHDLGARHRLTLPRGEPKARHAGDARQRLSAEAERADCRQVINRADLARRVPFQREQRIVPVHPAAVIDHAHERDAAAPDAHSTLRAPASILFSTSSFTTDAGRSTTSPAATWLARISGRRRIRLIGVSNLDLPLRIAKENGWTRASPVPAPVDLPLPRDNLATR
jgi:hypothetical protein